MCILSMVMCFCFSSRRRHTRGALVTGVQTCALPILHGALNPKGAARALADSAWFAKTTDRIVATMEGGRSTWQYWHVYAEAQRQVRAANVPTNQVSQVVDPLVSEVLDGHSVSMARPRSEEHTSELQSLMRISYAVFCLKKKNTNNQKTKLQNSSM